MGVALFVGNHTTLGWLVVVFAFMDASSFVLKLTLPHPVFEVQWIFSIVGLVSEMAILVPTILFMQLGNEIDIGVIASVTTLIAVVYHMWIMCSLWKNRHNKQECPEADNVNNLHIFSILTQV